MAVLNSACKGAESLFANARYGFAMPGFRMVLSRLQRPTLCEGLSSPKL